MKKKALIATIFIGVTGLLLAGYFVGCGVDIIQQDAGRATIEILKKIGKSVMLLDNCCCGLPAWTYGDLEVAKKLAEKNLITLSAGNFDVIVTDCSSCASFLKKYPVIFKDDDQKHQMAKNIFPRLKDMVELLYSNLDTWAVKNEHLIVTYHDPCHGSRGQGLVKEPREILKKIPGIEYRELPEADWCCGGAGSYALTHYDLSRSVLDRKMDNLKKTEADVLVTSCPACMIQLSYGIRKHGLKTKVRHISELIRV